MLRRRAALRAFTLIELLVVLAIIITLAGLLFPVIGGVQERARKTQAASDCSQIATAVRAYFAEYGKYPMGDGQQGYDTVIGNPPPGNPLYRSSYMFNALRAIADGNWNQNHALNPKRVIYFEGKQAKNPAKPVNGFVLKSGDTNDGCYYDPFGKEYVTFLDGDYNGQMDFYMIYNDLGSPSTNDALRMGVGVSSLGKDQTFGANGDGKFRGSKSDDVATWQ